MADRQAATSNPLLRLSLRFLLAAVLLLSASRTALAIWQAPRLHGAADWLALMTGGLRIDLSLIAILMVVPLVLAPWLGRMRPAAVLTAWWYRAWWVGLVLMEAATPQFLIEYDSRPNRLFFEYLESPREVFSMLWTGYKPVLAAVAVIAVLAAWSSRRLFRAQPAATAARAAGGARLPAGRPRGWIATGAARTGLSLLLLVACALPARGTLGHRGINPAFVAFSSDRMVNSLVLNSTYSVAYAVQSMKHESHAAEQYGQMDDADVTARIRRAAGFSGPPLNPDIPTLHLQRASRHPARPPNLVLIVEESLGAQYSGRLGGMGLTPELDALADEGWWFERLYATGTRSVRGLEALTAGFLPTPARAVLKLPKAQGNFFTLASLLGKMGYHSRFVYGGESHFDNMKGFFLANGFDEVHDLPKFSHRDFTGSWGACDEDMLAEVDRLLRTDQGPTFTLAFSVSNHSPWQYPPGRIQPVGDPASVVNTVRYADYAIGQFFRTAKNADYWNNTIFLVVADHDARVHGAATVPVTHFHIPALILGGGVARRSDSRLVSQVDLAPTLLSLMGVDAVHPMPGADLTQRDPDRALMQYGNTLGYRVGDHLVALRPQQPASHFQVLPDDTLKPTTADAELEGDALAHALWASRTYDREQYPASGAHPCRDCSDGNAPAASR